MRATTTSPDPAVSAATTQNAVVRPQQVGDQTREQRAGGEPGIAPQPADTDRSGRQIGWATSPIAANRVG
jgi:hypothetical protein